MVLRLIGTVATFTVVWAAVGYALIVSPRTDRPVRVDAIVVLGPPSAAGALRLAVILIKSGYSKNLIISTDEPKFDKSQCKPRPNGVHVFCFFPKPATTVGEADYATALAAKEHWKSLMVITGVYHASRSRFVFERCFPGKLVVVGSNHRISRRLWRHSFFYESGAWLKAIVADACHPHASLIR